MNPEMCRALFVFPSERLPGRGRADVCLSPCSFRCWWPPSCFSGRTATEVRAAADREQSGSGGKLWGCFQHLERTVIASSLPFQTSARQTGWTDGGEKKYQQLVRSHAASLWILAGCWRPTQLPVWDWSRASVTSNHRRSAFALKLLFIWTN